MNIIKTIYYRIFKSRRIALVIIASYILMIMGCYGC